MRMDKPHLELSTSTMRRWSFTRTVFYLIFSVLVVGNFALFFQHFGLIQHSPPLQWPSAEHAYHAFEKKDASPGSGELEGRSTLWTAPSVSCDLCPAADDFCMDLGHHNIAQSVAYEGSNARVHQLLRKLKSGKPISVGVIGGSVSTGHGLNRDGPTNEKEGPLNMHRQVYDWIQRKFPNKDHKFANGAIPASGSNYFATCFAEHIPEDADLVLIELGSTRILVMGMMLTGLCTSDSDITVQKEYEELLRGLLALPNKPAVVSMELVGLVFNYLSTGADQHMGVSQYYDVPVVSIRSLILPLIFRDGAVARRFFVAGDEEQPDGTFKYHVDTRHLNAYGHSVMSNLTRVYFERQLCKMSALDELQSQGYEPSHSSPDWPSRELATQMPSKLLLARYDKDIRVPDFKPQCFSTASKKNPLVPAEAFGWTHWSWKDKKYLVGRVPGAKFSMPVHTAIGTVKVYYQRSAKYGLGQVDCWLDHDVHNKKRLDGYWDLDISIVQNQAIAQGVKPGKHVVHCEVVEDTNDSVTGGHEFRVTSITAL
ncbi:hypothetical protein QFC21_001232 [Naganishia friedmannii]|uniref:Uncharacterized protein n=1 Tax=Naganishia friedmannii TaxID=89922 RepID=A0ACC2W4T2_9TREE|nr:hypothetical protein QFC21_001232 [Naganishia friedmannii]